MHSPEPRRANLATKSRPLVGNFEENILNNRLSPIRTVDGYLAEIRASSRNFQPSPSKYGVQVSFFSAGDCFPYLGQVHIGHRGYRIPKKGTLQVTLFNPNEMLVKLFVLFYDLTDMPPNSQTILRQKTLYLPVEYEHADDGKSCSSINLKQHTASSEPKSKHNNESRVRYMIQLK